MAAAAGLARAADTTDRHYTFGAPARDGIGKFYLGREIAQVMGHRGAAWLDWIETRDFLPTQHFMVFAKPKGIL